MVWAFFIHHAESQRDNIFIDINNSVYKKLQRSDISHIIYRCSQ